MNARVPIPEEPNAWRRSKLRRAWHWLIAVMGGSLNPTVRLRVELNSEKTKQLRQNAPEVFVSRPNLLDLGFADVVDQRVWNGGINVIINSRGHFPLPIVVDVPIDSPIISYGPNARHQSMMSTRQISMLVLRPNMGGEDDTATITFEDGTQLWIEVI